MRERDDPGGPTDAPTAATDVAAMTAMTGSGATATSLLEPPAATLIDLVAEDAAGTYGELEPAATPPFDEHGRVRLSFSSIDAYQLCPSKFRFGYVDRLPSAPAPALSFGSAIHAALERFYDRKLPQPPSVDELLRYLYECWDASGFEGVERDVQLSYYRHAQDVLRRYHARVNGTYRLPADVERYFELPFGDDTVVVGSIDRVDVRDDGAFEVVDYKTNRRIRDRAHVRSSLQLAIYALACEELYGALPAAVVLDFVVAGVQVRVPLADVDLDGARAAVAATAAAVRASAYDPTPNRLCDWCDFRALCPAWEGDGPDVLGPASERLRTLRTQVRRDVRALRDLEHALARMRVATPPGVRVDAAT